MLAEAERRAIRLQPLRLVEKIKIYHKRLCYRRETRATLCIS